MFQNVGCLRTGAAPLALALLATCVTPTFGQSAKKTTLPPESAQAEALELAKEIYGEQYARAVTPAQKQALGEALVQKAQESKADPAAHFVLLKLARDIAAQGGDVQLALRAVEEMDRTYQMDAIPWKADAVLTAAKAADAKEQHTAVAESAMELIDEAVAKDRFDSAAQLAEAALASARKAGNAALTRSIVDRRERVEAIRAEHERIRDSLAALEARPTDPEANLAVGKYYSFIQGDWQKGVPMLALGSEPRLQELARQELEGPASAEEQVKLANAWWDFAATADALAQKNIRSHAVVWYERALPKLTGLTKAVVERRLQEALPSPEELRLPAGAVLLFTFDERDFIRRGGAVFAKDLSGQNNHGLVVGAKLAPGKVGTALSFDAKNSHVECRNTESLNLAEAFTICAWVNARNWRDGAIDYIVSNDAWGEGGARGFVLRGQSHGSPGFTVGSDGWRAAHSPEKLKTGEWRHLAATCGDGQITFYVDGVAKANAAAPTPIAASEFNLRIGRGPFAAERGFDGLIDEVAIFKRSLTPEEVKAVYLLGAQGQSLDK